MSAIEVAPGENPALFVWQAAQASLGLNSATPREQMLGATGVGLAAYITTLLSAGATAIFVVGAAFLFLIGLFRFALRVVM